ncbi:MAG: sugar transferase [Verrucomicrobia bacterium]|nr:sugar transferase [Verrucomicrobiota bacterium]
MIKLFSSKQGVSRDSISSRGCVGSVAHLSDRVSACDNVPVFPSERSVGHDPVVPAGSEEVISGFGAGTTILRKPVTTWAFEYGEPIGVREPAADVPAIPVWKRVLDCVCILLSLPVCLPLMLAIALWIMIVSPGPIFFQQERVGYRRRHFMILKFRTMKVNVETLSHERHLDHLMASDRPMAKLDAAGDPRIIRGGRVLRALGLDELPQLLNVLRGEMSLVGPRPCTVHEFARYQPWQQERVNVPPGLTGYWQVNGKNRTTFTEMINLDIFYTKNMSLWLDLAIIIKTLPAVITQFLETRTRVGAGERRR